MLLFLVWTIVHQNTLITKKDILIFGKGLTQVLEVATSLTAVDEYAISFTELGMHFFFFSLYLNRSNSFLFVYGVKIYEFKSKNFERKPDPLRLENISKDFTINNMKKTRVNGHVN